MEMDGNGGVERTEMGKQVVSESNCVFNHSFYNLAYMVRENNGETRM